MTFSLQFSLMSTTLISISTLANPTPKNQICSSPENDPKNPYLLFGSWTRYFEAYHKDTTHPLYSNPFHIDNCKPKSFWLLARHGSRTLGDEKIAKINKRIPEIQNHIINNHVTDGKGTLCKHDLERLSNWTFDLTKEDAYLLTESGKNEMKMIGQRLKSKFPDIFDEGFNDKEIIFRSTNRSGTIESAISFGEGAFPGYEFNIPDPVENDPILRFYKFCDQWLKGVESNEEEFFKKSVVFVEALTRMNSKLGFEVDLETQ